MATRVFTETDCDRCKSQNVPVYNLKVITRRDLDPAGGASSDGGEKFDLCIKCAGSLLASLVNMLPDNDTRAKWIKTIKVEKTEQW